MPDFDAGVLKPVIDRQFTLDQIVAAHEHMEANANIGKSSSPSPPNSTRRMPPEALARLPD
ncbi:MAG: hypothetical protein EBQ57_00210 [Actinobacteria bacterium]|nr:hypothetical protein [Actinomycetota bacterium]